jgi:quercetin dioxygenase-like cupin family protein
MKRLPDLLPDFARESLDGDSNRDQAESGEALVELNELLVPIPPSTEARGRLLLAVSAAPLKYAPFFDRLSSFFDLSPDRVEQILADVNDRARWEPAPLPGVLLMHFAGGPKVASADVGLVRIEPDYRFPNHRHKGEERLFVLEGGYTDSTGRKYEAGDVQVMQPNTTHDYTVLPGGLLAALVLYEGIEIVSD